MHIILRSEETGFPITRTCPTSRQGDLLFLDAFVFMVWFSPAQKPTPDRSNRGRRGSARQGCMGVCVCVRWNVRFSVRFARSVLPKIIPTIYQLYELFFLLLGYIILWGSHIKLVCDNFEFYFLRLGNLKLMLLRSFFLFASRICFVYALMFMCQSI